ncbi:glycosyltransferase family A protein [Microbacter sp. GSS18]|nr:glycosyltransferase family A protein [Microbacter sp. GSS18]
MSIITRTKDRPVLLSRALESIAAQDFDDWEVLIVNDGGDPAAVARCVAALTDEQRARVRQFDNPAPTGRWPAANQGVREATGEYLILHDDDDRWSPAFLSRAVAYLDADPERDGVVARTTIIWERPAGEGYETFATEQFVPESVAPLLMDQMRFNHFVPIAFLYRRRLHDEIGLYDDRHPVVADWQFNTKVLLRGPLEYLDDEPLVFWHQRPSAQGTAGNSVIAESDAHARFDALLRDEAFRRLVDADGSGMALYFERRLAELERSIVSRLESRHLLYRAARAVVLRFRALRGTARR